MRGTYQPSSHIDRGGEVKILATLPPKGYDANRGGSGGGCTPL
jgi:hypothetical protein